jgi:ubiquinone/menaquinone biosynthesis C-methylase UbiE
MTDVTDAWRRDHPWASVYDFFVQRGQLSRGLGWLLWGTDVRRLYRATETLASVPDGGAILDVPCGGGVAFRGLRPDQQVRYVAADVSPAMLERARREAARRGLEQIEYVEADVEALPFGDREFDLCISLTGLHCFPNPQAAVAEIVRCLRPGGRLVGSALLTDSGLRYEPLIVLGRRGGIMGPSGNADEVQRWLAEAGLQEITLERSGALGYFSARRAG